MSSPAVPDHVVSAVAGLVRRVKSLTNGMATVREHRSTDVPSIIVDIQPVNPAACPITIVAEQFVILLVGAGGCRWEMSYDETDVSTIMRVMRAVVEGSVEKRYALGRSSVRVTLDDGTVSEATTRRPLAWLSVRKNRAQRSFTIYQPYAVRA